MELDVNQLTRAQCYKLLTSLVVPRPIALVTTLTEGSIVNAAPFTFFNVIGDDPPILMISADVRTDGAMKHTVRNILASKQFVVNLVDEAIAEKMHGASVEAPSEMSEIDLVGFTTAPSQRIKPPRIAESPIAFECELHTELDFNARRMLIGQIVWINACDGIIDPGDLRRIPNMYHPVGRLYANRYCRTRDEFVLDNSHYKDVASKFGK